MWNKFLVLSSISNASEKKKKVFKMVQLPTAFDCLSKTLKQTFCSKLIRPITAAQSPE